MKYLVYYRVSTERQGRSGLGLEGQSSIVNHYLKPEDIEGEYTEVLSGRIGPMGRPVLAEVIARCKQEGLGLAVAKVDRLSRVTEDALQVYNELGGYLFCCDVPTSKTGVKIDKFVLTLLLAIADRESELISVRTKAAMQAKRNRGERVGNPNGGSELAKARAKSKEVRRMKALSNKNYIATAGYASSLREQGLSLRDIAARLNGEGLKTSTGKTFNAVQVSRLITRYAENN